MHVLSTYPTYIFDLGSSMLRVMDSQGKLLLTTPSIVVTDEESDTVVAIGEEALRFMGEQIQGVRVRPIVQDGLLADEQALLLLLSSVRSQLEWSLTHEILQPRGVVLIPTHADPTHIRAVTRALKAFGFAFISPVYTPTVVADSAHAQLIVDMGAQKTDVAVIARGRVISSRCLVWGVEDCVRSVQSTVHRERGVHILLSDLLKRVKTLPAVEEGKDYILSLKGTDVRTLRISSTKVPGKLFTQSLENLVERIVEHVKVTLLRAPDLHRQESIESGVHLIGAGATLAGMSSVLTKQLEMPSVVERAADTLALARAAQHTRQATIEQYRVKI